MAYKGTIPANTLVTITLDLPTSASGPASITAGFSDGNSNQSGGTVVAPGATGAVVLSPDAKGMLQIFVDMAIEGDSGALSVTSDGHPEGDDTIQGDTVWTYAVVVA